MDERYSFTYILTNDRHTVFYTGVTSNIIKRIWEHKNHVVDGFTKRYNVGILVYYEMFCAIEDAIAREKQIKGKSRQYKVDLITKTNPVWRDLYEDLL